MASPIGHSLAGLSIYLACNTEIWGRKVWKVVLLYVFLANLPDIDFIPGIFIGNPGYFHHGITHTLGFTVLAVLTCVFIAKLKKVECWPICGIVFLLIFSHLIIDLFTRDNLSPYGIMVLWPFSRTYFYPSFLIFTEINREGIKGIFSLSNILAGLKEFFIFIPVVLGLLYFRFRQQKKKQQPRVYA